MTCIIGLKDKGDIYMGGDSAGVEDLHLQIRADEKVFINSNYIMGFTDSYRMGQLLRYSLKPPKNINMELYDFMVNEFINEVRKCLKEGGFIQKKDEVEKGGAFLVGYKGRLFCVDEDFQVGEMIDDFVCCGCGRDMALGSLYSTKDLHMNPFARITLALEAAERYSIGVRGPFKIIRLVDEK